jgi:hypothetical protein
VYSAADPALFLEGFNSSMLDCDKPIWAVAVPVAIEGDAVCGRPVTGCVLSGDETARQPLDEHTVYDF